MKKTIAIAMVLVLSLGLMAGCRSRGNDNTTAPTTRPTTAPTTRPTTAPTTMPTTEPTTDTTMMPGTDDMMPDGEDMIPGPEDTIDPTNGANNSTVDSRFRKSGF